jgi:hypothetical protein
MNCIWCGSDTKVTDSRPSKDGIRRRRECKKCGCRFTTREYVIKDVEDSDTESGLSATIDGSIISIETAKRGYSCSTCGEKIRRDVSYLQVIINRTGDIHRLCEDCAPKLLIGFETFLNTATHNFKKIKAFYV